MCLHLNTYWGHLKHMTSDSYLMLLDLKKLQKTLELAETEIENNT